MGVLHRISQCNCRVLLVAPRWPARLWFPILLILSVGRPWQLPFRKDLLSQMDGRVPGIQVQPVCSSGFGFWVRPSSCMRTCCCSYCRQRESCIDMSGIFSLHGADIPVSCTIFWKQAGLLPRRKYMSRPFLRII